MQCIMKTGFSLAMLMNTALPPHWMADGRQCCDEQQFKDGNIIDAMKPLRQSCANIKRVLVNRRSCQDDDVNPAADEKHLDALHFNVHLLGSVYNLVHFKSEICCSDTYVRSRVIYDGFFL